MAGGLAVRVPDPEALGIVRRLVEPNERGEVPRGIAFQAARLCEAPLAGVSFVDADREWGKRLRAQDRFPIYSIIPATVE